MRLVFTIETGDAERDEPASRSLLGRLAERQGRSDADRGDDPVLEVAPPPPVAPGRLEAAWERLVEGQQRLMGELGQDSTRDAERRLWIGGAMAIYAACVGEDEVAVGRRLGEAVPVPTYRGLAILPPHPTERPAAHTGAQRVIDPDDPPMPPDPGLAGPLADPPS
jgi:hypothetical protein